MKNLVFISWSDENDMGIDLIDEQHRGIVSIINALYYFMQKGRGKSELLNILDMLESYVKTHFEIEENLMQEAGYKDVEAHKQMHHEFSKKIQLAQAQITRINEPLELLKSLKEWWLEHMQKEDRKYISSIKKSLDIS